MIRVPESAPPTPNKLPRAKQLPPWLTVLLAISATVISILLLAMLLFQLVRPALRSARLNTRQNTCQRRVEHLVRAIYAYRNDHGSFPPAFTVDEQGRPRHSWRVLLLPYLGPDANWIFTQIRIDEPWDSEHNRAFANRAPTMFVCPDDARFDSGETSYCAVVGDQFAFRPGVGVTADQLGDDTTTMLLVVEVHNSGINWMEPLDVKPNELAHGINSGVKGTCGSNHPGGRVTVGTADGRGRSLSDSTRPNTLHEMATIDGNESPQPMYAP